MAHSNQLVTEFTEKLKTQTLTTDLNKEFKPNSTVEYQGTFIEGSAFKVQVKRGSLSEDNLDKLITRNIDSFAYQMSLGNSLKGL